MSALSPHIAPEPGSAAAAHRRRAEICAELKAGDLDVDALLTIAAVEAPIARLLLDRAIRSYSAWNQRSTAELYAQFRIPTKARVQWLLDRADTHRDLIEQINLGPGQRPPLPAQWPVHGRCEWIEAHA